LARASARALVLIHKSPAAQKKEKISRKGANDAKKDKKNKKDKAKTKNSSPFFSFSFFLFFSFFFASFEPLREALIFLLIG
jgi:hypothetical protein